MLNKPETAKSPILELVARLKSRHLDPTTACELVRDAGINEADLYPWAKFGHDPHDSYGRGVVYDGDGIEVMVATWEPSDMSTIHNHGHLQWGAVQVFGRIEHAVFEYEGTHLSTVNREFLPGGTILEVNNALYHQMGSADSRPFLTLHVYGSNTTSAGVTHDAEIVDLYAHSVLLSKIGRASCRERVCLAV